MPGYERLKIPGLLNFDRGFEEYVHKKNNNSRTVHQEPARRSPAGRQSAAEHPEGGGAESKRSHLVGLPGV